MVSGKSLLLTVILAVLASAREACAEDGPQVIEQARRGVVTVYASGGVTRHPGAVPFFQEETEGSNILGSGIVLSKDGAILTANHAIDGIQELSVVLWDSTEAKAAVIAREPGLDIALLRVQNADLVPIPWRTGPDAPVGAAVFAIGTPSIFPDSPTPSVTRGIISAYHRSLDTTGDPEAQFMTDLIETDAQLLPGESGGALVDAQGQLMGMCLAIYQPGGAIRSRGFALAADDWLRKGIDSMLAGGAFPIGQFGIHLSTLPADAARHMGLPPDRRVRADWVQKNGPADKAGIKPGDVVISVDGQPVRMASELRRLEMRLSPGTAARVALLRGTPPQPQEVTVTVAAAQSPESLPPAELQWRGMRLRDIDQNLRREMGIAVRTGVAVVGVAPKSSAFKAGLRVGDVIVEVNNTRVDSLSEFRDTVDDIPESNMVRVKTTEGVGHIQGETGTE